MRRNAISTTLFLLLTACASTGERTETEQRDAEPLEFEVRAIAGVVDDAPVVLEPEPADASDRASDPPVTPHTKEIPAPAPRRTAPSRPFPNPTTASNTQPLTGVDEDALVPQTILLRSEVIEIERAAGVPVAVLIEAGAPTGVSRGLRGRLLDHGQEIGRVEIVDVYSGGSRAKILGKLGGDITDETVVEVFHPSE